MDAAGAAVRQAAALGLAATSPWRFWETAVAQAGVAQRALDDVATLSPDNAAVKVARAAIPHTATPSQRLHVLRAALQCATADAATPLAGIALRVLESLKGTPQELPACQDVLAEVAPFLAELSAAGADPRWALQRAAAGLPTLDPANRAALVLAAATFTSPTEQAPDAPSRILELGLEKVEDGARERGATAEAEAVATLREMAAAVPILRPVITHAALQALREKVPATADQLAATGLQIVGRSWITAPAHRAAMGSVLLDGIQRLADAAGDTLLVPPLVASLRADPSRLLDGLNEIAATRFDRTVLAADRPVEQPAVQVEGEQITIAGIPIQRREG